MGTIAIFANYRAPKNPESKIAQCVQPYRFATEPSSKICANAGEGFRKQPNHTCSPATSASVPPAQEVPSM